MLPAGKGHRCDDHVLRQLPIVGRLRAQSVKHTARVVGTHLEVERIGPRLGEALHAQVGVLQGGERTESQVTNLEIVTGAQRQIEFTRTRTSRRRPIESAEVDVAADRIAVIRAADQGVEVEVFHLVGAEDTEAHRVVDRPAAVVFGLQALVTDIHAGGQGLVPRVSSAGRHPATLRTVILRRPGARGIGEDPVAIDEGPPPGFFRGIDGKDAHVVRAAHLALHRSKIHPGGGETASAGTHRPHALEHRTVQRIGHVENHARQRRILGGHQLFEGRRILRNREGVECGAHRAAVSRRSDEGVQCLGHADLVRGDGEGLVANILSGQIKGIPVDGQRVAAQPKHPEIVGRKRGKIGRGQQFHRTARQGGPSQIEIVHPIGQLE